jgi:hypothetical protein
MRLALALAVAATLLFGVSGSQARDDARLVTFRWGDEVGSSVTLIVRESGQSRIVDTTGTSKKTIRYTMNSERLATLEQRIAKADLPTLASRYDETGPPTTCGPPQKTVTADGHTVHIGGGYPTLPPRLEKLVKRLLSIINTRDPVSRSGSRAHAAQRCGGGTRS